MLAEAHGKDGAKAQWGHNTYVWQERLYKSDGTHFGMSVHVTYHKTEIVTWTLNMENTDGWIASWDSGGWCQANGKPTRTTTMRLNFWLPEWRDMEENTGYPAGN